MAVINRNNSFFSDTLRFELTDSSLIVDEGGHIVQTGSQSAVYLETPGSIDVLVKGTVVSTSPVGHSGIITGNGLTDPFSATMRLEIAATGIVHGTQNGFAHFSDAAVELINSGSLQGTKYGTTVATGSTGYLHLGDGASFVTNSGIIQGSMLGIDYSSGGVFTSTGLHSIINSGTIRALLSFQADSYAIRSITVNTLGAGSVDRITNSGLIDGNVAVGHNNDVITNTGGGRITGTVYLGDGQDSYTGGNSYDIVYGDEGHDHLVGNGGGDQLTGGTGDDWLNGGAGLDALFGGQGNDTFIVDVSNETVIENDTIAAGGGVDWVYATASFTLTQNVENLRLLGTAAIHGTGNSFENTLIGNSAGNRLDGGADHDTMTGGDGSDTYFVDNVLDAVNETSATAAGGTDRVVATVSYALSANVEQLFLAGVAPINGAGNGLANFMIGNGETNVLNGNGGDDQLNGGGGNDVLLGGFGNDTLIGGSGFDAFLFNLALNAAANRDTITDFTANADKVRLDNSVFSLLGAPGALNPAFFRANASGTAQDGNDYVVYNTTTGALFYDVNGNAAGGAIQFATLSSKPTITAADFLVV